MQINGSHYLGEGDIRVKAKDAATAEAILATVHERVQFIQLTRTAAPSYPSVPACLQQLYPLPPPPEIHTGSGALSHFGFETSQFNYRIST